jgi:hypothetical protein
MKEKSWLIKDLICVENENSGLRLKNYIGKRDQ